MFSAIEKSSTSPRRWRSSGMWPRPASRECERVCVRHVLVRRPGSRPAETFRSPVDRVDQLGLAVAVDAGDADDLAGADRRARRRSPSSAPGRPRRRDPRPSVAARRARTAALSTRSRTSRPTMSVARLCSVAPAAGSVSIFLPRRRTVIRSAMSVTSFSLWLMKMIDLPCSVRLLRIVKSSCASCGVSTAVGSSRIRMSAPR